ncbi:LemA family protein [Pediococcus ethanolidurans]|uniref:LemA family protein n=1 Tax=Pediococcus ethanolidurans TaxID=319653 RepID=UPI001C1EE951|nr:LemA family protein [Pediococcus ethanolidurans]MBU7555480.1 LemA family protein [Pediococcus ethanolidurans]MBU7564238.1 LemA family protein [Pediococcus ethanolidurans]MCV3315873.1 LemA family protein [Pediococcus ethanolidurans]MCV3324212.1 LemA family protein [Pediococcus ethanolidurans]MCV3555722.1 LemA family protein [Pediococcus ethanolidurans]
MTIGIIIAIIVVILIGLFIILYNNLVKARTYTQESWSQINGQLKRRNDLIPNLVSTVQGYASYEKSTLSKVVELRNQLVSVTDNPQANSVDRAQTMALSDQLSSQLKSVFALSESYPDLKASAEFTKLMEELTNTENKIAYSRQLYNSSVASYNMKLQTFPSNLVASMTSFKAATYLQVPEEETKTPDVSFKKYEDL